MFAALVQIKEFNLNLKSVFSLNWMVHNPAVVVTDYMQTTEWRVQFSKLYMSNIEQMNPCHPAALKAVLLFSRRWSRCNRNQA